MQLYPGREGFIIKLAQVWYKVRIRYKSTSSCIRECRFHYQICDLESNDFEKVRYDLQRTRLHQQSVPRSCLKWWFQHSPKHKPSKTPFKKPTHPMSGGFIGPTIKFHFSPKNTYPSPLIILLFESLHLKPYKQKTYYKNTLGPPVSPIATMFSHWPHSLLPSSLTFPSSTLPVRFSVVAAIATHSQPATLVTCSCPPSPPFTSNDCRMLDPDVVCRAPPPPSSSLPVLVPVPPSLPLD